MRYLLNQYLCLIIYLIFCYYFPDKKCQVDYENRVDYEIEIFKDLCYLNVVTLIYDNSMDNFLFKGTVTNFSRDFIINLIDSSNLTRIKYS